MVDLLVLFNVHPWTFRVFYWGLRCKTRTGHGFFRHPFSIRAGSVGHSSFVVFMSSSGTEEGSTF